MPVSKSDEHGMRRAEKKEDANKRGGQELPHDRTDQREVLNKRSASATVIV
jgi:hypothetical protein